jgi:ATP-dependent RNA helicase DeaD
MSEAASSDLAEAPQALRDPLLRRGFTALTPIQTAVLDPELQNRDLRLSSQTGSGKTVALGFLLADHVAPSAEGRGPFAIVLVPTRELAAQVQSELAWLFADLKARVISVTGGMNPYPERKALEAGAEVVVGTPGRLLDHLTRGSLDPAHLRALVLDEADQMLDLGFRDELEAIVERLPAARRTHLVSATFSREVVALADRLQKDAVAVEGTRLGAANHDIEHIAHAVHPTERDAAIVNLLLLAPEERTLIFVRTRAAATEVAQGLSESGFSAAPMTGEMEQRERTRTLDAFRNGQLRILVATDVAARGIDVADIGRVIHADPPENLEALTHRSGRTGRAGKKGTSIVLTSPRGIDRVSQLFRAARVQPKWAPLPDADAIRAAADQRLRRDLESSEQEPPARLLTLAASLLESSDPVALVARLLGRTSYEGPCEPRPITSVSPRRDSAPRPRPAAMGAPVGNRRFVPFRINWGERHGADPRRLLAMVCRRGNVRGQDVGAIQIGPTQSSFEIEASVSDEFARSIRRPDPRDPRVRIEPIDFDAAAAASAPTAPVMARRPPFRKPRPAVVETGSEE